VAQRRDTKAFKKEKLKFCVKMKGTQHQKKLPVFNARPLQAI
jgi:hypothetical protein